ncbi:MAG TPA: hypothetical protein VFI31_17140 [Pirellulales bacterium]|nr:hypothetical protein [Pirellulales bacterium]
MIDPANVPPVSDDELLARYILQSSHIRGSDRSLKPDAFIPHPHTDLSVTRHFMATEEELWSAGLDVATARGKTFYGRGDFSAATCLGQRLNVEAAPLPNNPNHANVRGWPAEKPLQKIIAQQIAATARFVEAPGGTFGR